MLGHKKRTSPPLWDGEIRGTTQLAPNAASMTSAAQIPLTRATPPLTAGSSGLAYGSYPQGSFSQKRNPSLQWMILPFFPILAFAIIKFGILMRSFIIVGNTRIVNKKCLKSSDGKNLKSIITIPICFNKNIVIFL